MAVLKQNKILLNYSDKINRLYDKTNLQITRQTLINNSYNIFNCNSFLEKHKEDLAELDQKINDAKYDLIKRKLYVSHDYIDNYPLSNSYYPPIDGSVALKTNKDMSVIFLSDVNGTKNSHLDREIKRIRKEVKILEEERECARKILNEYKIRMPFLRRMLNIISYYENVDFAKDIISKYSHVINILNDQLLTYATAFLGVEEAYSKKDCEAIRNFLELTNKRANLIVDLNDEDNKKSKQKAQNSKQNNTTQIKQTNFTNLEPGEEE